MIKEFKFSDQDDDEENSMPDFGPELILIDDFVSAFKIGAYTSYDGSGYYGTENEVSKRSIWDGKPEEGDTHIWWYYK